MKRIVSILLLISILTTTGSIAILPTPVEASTASVIAQAGGCVGSAALSQFLSNMIDKGMEVLQENIKKIANKYVQKLLGNLVEGFLGSSVPVSAKDQSMLSFFQNKYYRDDVIARCVARQILDNITNNTATIIKTRGRDGGPAFVTNWTNFLTKAQYRGENIFRAELSTAQLCGYLSEGIKKSFGVNPNKKLPWPDKTLALILSNPSAWPQNALCPPTGLLKNINKILPATAVGMLFLECSNPKITLGA